MKTFYIDIDLLDSETGLNFISFVESPAIEVEWLKFSKTEKQTFSIEDEEKRIVYGPALIANKEIYRRKEDFEYNVVFTENAIRKIIEKYSASGLINSVDENHNESPISDVVMVESFLIDRKNGIDPIQFKDINDGSWIVKFKVNNEELWQDIKTGKVRGFSVSGLFNVNEEKFKNDEPETVEELISYILN